MKKKLIKISLLSLILTTILINTGCKSNTMIDNKFDEKNIVDVSISYINEEDRKEYEDQYSKKYPNTHLLKITNNSDEIISEGYVHFNFINDSGIEEIISTQFLTINPGQAFYTPISSTMRDIAASKIEYTLGDYKTLYTVYLEDKKVEQCVITSNEEVDFDSCNIINFNSKDLTIEELGYMSNIFVDTYNFDITNNSNIDLENVSGTLYFYDQDNNIVDVKYPYGSLFPNDTKSVSVKDDNIPSFTKESVKNEIVKYSYQFLDSKENRKWNYIIDLQNKRAFRNSFVLN